MTGLALPLLPGRGNRRELDALWLAQLRRDGWQPYLPRVPALPLQFRVALQEFNEGHFQRCHRRIVRRVWYRTPYPIRLFYQGVTKSAVGFHHLAAHNRGGAMAQFVAASVMLEPFLPEFMGVPTQSLSDELRTWLGRLADAEEPSWVKLDTLPRPLIVVNG